MRFNEEVTESINKDKSKPDVSKLKVKIKLIS